MRAGLLVLFTLVMAMAWSEASGQPHHARRASQRSASIPGFRPAHEKLAGTNSGENRSPAPTAEPSRGNALGSPTPASLPSIFDLGDAPPTPDASASTSDEGAWSEASQTTPDTTDNVASVVHTAESNNPSYALSPTRNLPESRGHDLAASHSVAGVQPVGFAQSTGSQGCSGCAGGGHGCAECDGFCSDCDGGMSDCGGQCGACDACTLLPRFWGSAEYLLWWTQGLDTPVLATSSAGTLAQGTAAILGDINTSSLFGADPLHQDARSGGRYRLGMWFDDWNQHGIEGTFLGLIDDEETFVGASPGFAVLARPFFNVEQGREDARLIVFPNVTSGGLEIRSATEFQTYEANYRRVHSQVGVCSLETLLGYRGANLDESLLFRESTQGLSGPAQGATIALTESFRTENQFHGGQLGLLLASQRTSSLSLELLAKVALGNTQQRVNVAGSTATTLAGATTTTQAGLLTQGTNIRTLEQNEFSTITELGIALRKHLPADLSVSLGYTFMHWSDVLRAGELIDRNINPTQIPPGTLTGEARPSLPLESKSFWAQGLTVGLEYHF